MRATRSILCLVATAFLADIGRGQDPPEGGGDPVRSLVESLKHLKHAEIRAVAQASSSSNKLVLEGKAQSPVVVPWGTYTFLYRRDADRLMVSEVHSRLRKGRPSIFQTDWILKNGKILNVSDRLDEQLVQMVQTGAQVGILLTSPKIAGSAAAVDTNELMGGLNDFGILFGYLGYYPLADYFGDSAQVGIEDEGELIRVDSQSALGRLRMWLDPASGFLPRKLELVKRGADRTNDNRRVDEIDMNGNEKTWPEGGVKQLQWTADGIVLRRSGDVFYIAKITLVHKTVSEAGPVVTITTDAEVESIDFQPSFGDGSFSPLLEIPEDHPVTAEFAEHLPFKWDGEKVVPAADDVDRLASGRQGGARRFYWILAVNLVLAALVVGFFLFRRSRLRKSQP